MVSEQWRLGHAETLPTQPSVRLATAGAGGRRPPPPPPTETGGSFWEREDPEEKLLGEDGVRDLLVLWRRIPRADRLSPLEIRERRLHDVLVGSRFSVYAVAVLELIAESQWRRRRSPDSIVPLRSKALRASIMDVFSSPTPVLRLEGSLFSIASMNPNGCLGDRSFVSILTKWKEWMHIAEEQAGSNLGI